MTDEAPQPPRGASRRGGLATSVYVGVVAAVGVCLTAAAIRVDGIAFDPTFWVFALLAMLTWWFGSMEVDAGRVNLSFTGIVLLAAIALVGPAGAGIIGTIMGPFEQGRAPLRARVFNTGMFATMGVLGGAAYIAVGGVPGSAAPSGTKELVLHIGLPVLFADVVQFVVNLVLIAIVVRLAAGLSMRTQMGRLLGSAGPAHLGYGIIAFIMVVLWGPAGLGSASVFLILPPLLVAQWAYGQYSEEVKGHERALGVLVAAVEAKAPHLVGHSARVAELSASMAEHLGLRAQVVADVRVAGMLHDLGLTTLPTGLVRSTGVVGGSGLRGYPLRGARLLRGLSFLAGALDAITHHREAVVPPTTARRELSLPALIVGLADEYDLLTEVGTPDGALARQRRRHHPAARDAGRPRRPGPRPRARAVAPHRRGGPVTTFFPRAHLSRAWTVLGVGITVLVAAAYAGSETLLTQLQEHWLTVVVFVTAVAVGELFRLRMPSGREAAPLASASALGIVFLGRIDGEPVFDVPAGFVVLAVAAGLLAAAVVGGFQGRTVGLDQVAARLIGVGVAAALTRAFAPRGTSLWDLAVDPGVSPSLVALGMVAVAGIGIGVEIVLTSAVRSERQRTPWLAALRDEIGEVAPLNFAVVASGPMVALMAPSLGLLSLPVALFPLAMTYVAVGRYAQNRMTYRQTIATLSHLTEHGGYTPTGHAERVADLSVRIGRVLGIADRDLRDVEYAALLHDLGQISLIEPIPGGATVLAAPSDQRDIADEGARIIRHAEGLETVASYVEAQTTPYRQVRELGEEVPVASRIIKVANAFDDLTGGRDDVAEILAANERIHLGLGYEYDPDVVEALAVATSDTTVGRVGEREPASR